MTEQPNPNELLLITREELERCCSQMSAAGYKVSANYVEASVLSRSRPTPAAEPKFNSTDLLVLAHDEWKRREERKRIHDETTWCAGFINGFLTDKKWALDLVDKMNKDAESLRREGEQG